MMMQMHCPQCTAFHAIGPRKPRTKAENPFWIVSQHINAQHPEVTHLCPRRSARGTVLQRDFWCVEPNGDKTCSHCGSLSEKDLREILVAFVEGKPGYYFATTDKLDKIRVNRPGILAGQGGTLFHLQHLSRARDGKPALGPMFDEAIARELVAFGGDSNG